MTIRQIQARQIRKNAAEIAYLREHPQHINNGEEFKYRNLLLKKDSNELDNNPTYIANFTKGLPHCTKTGLLLNPTDYQQFVLGIQSGDAKDFALTPLGTATPPPVPVPNTLSIPDPKPNWQSQIAQDAENCQGAKVRAWESAGAGLVFELQGFDAQAVTMPPAPTLDSVELAGEMAEVYLQALLRDVHFSELRTEGEISEDPCDNSNDHDQPPEKNDNQENQIKQASLSESSTEEEKCIMPVTVTDAVNILKNINPEITAQNIFRGQGKGVNIGPYISQFLLIGNDSLNPPNSSTKVTQVKDGFINYGAITIDQRVRVATRCKDYMTTFEAYVDVQNGADLRGVETYEGDNKNDGYRFIATPRDLATYVHYDALYEAYLNACLILLGIKAPFDAGIPFQQPDTVDKQQGFAHFGGPQILSLVCEVATRALKAVRYQKFNVHRRLRPEAVGGLIDRYEKGMVSEIFQPVKFLVKALKDLPVKEDKNLLDIVAEHNKNQNNNNPDRSKDKSKNDDLYLLPMAFPEGSPMHPSYGAGHATVAGACVTILKAFFDHGWIMTKPTDCNGKRQYIAYEASNDGTCLREVILDEPLTVEGELNKIAANISIGRNWAGVHYYSDYIESLRMGEQIAIGILEEQKLTYGENFTMTVPLYDGGSISI